MFHVMALDVDHLDVCLGHLVLVLLVADQMLQKLLLPGENFCAEQAVLQSQGADTADDIVDRNQHGQSGRLQHGDQRLRPKVQDNRKKDQQAAQQDVHLIFQTLLRAVFDSAYKNKIHGQVDRRSDGQGDKKGAQGGVSSVCDSQYAGVNAERQMLGGHGADDAEERPRPGDAHTEIDAGKAQQEHDQVFKNVAQAGTPDVQAVNSLSYPPHVIKKKEKGEPEKEPQGEISFRLEKMAKQDQADQQFKNIAIVDKKVM